MVDRKGNVIRSKCGALIDIEHATVWGSQVTCPACDSPVR